MRSMEASAARCCSRRWRITKLDWGCTASSQSSLARRALASGKLMASGSVAFYYANCTHARAAWRGSFHPQPGAHSGSPRGDIFNVGDILSAWQEPDASRRSSGRARRSEGGERHLRHPRHACLPAVQRRVPGRSAAGAGQCGRSGEPSTRLTSRAATARSSPPHLVSALSRASAHRDRQPRARGRGAAPGGRDRSARPL